MLPDDLRDLRPKEKLFFMFTIGVDKALHNARWAQRGALKSLLKELEIYIATDVNSTHKQSIPFLLVSEGDLRKVRDPHITEHTWKMISINDLEKMTE